MPPSLTLFAILAALGVGVAAGYYFRYLHALSKKRSLEIDIKEKTVEAEKKAIEIIEKAEAKAEQLLTDAKADLKEQTEKIKHKEFYKKIYLN